MLPIIPSSLGWTLFLLLAGFIAGLWQGIRVQKVREASDVALRSACKAEVLSNGAALLRALAEHREDPKAGGQ